MKISARGRYSMQALFDLAHHSHGLPVPLHTIAQRQGLSLPFLEQIFNRLKKADVVASVRGPRGGYVLTRPCNQVTVGEVLRLTDGGFSSGAQDDGTNPMSRILWERFSTHITRFLDSVTLADLCLETRSNRCGECSCPDHAQTVESRLDACQE